MFSYWQHIAVLHYRTLFQGCDVAPTSEVCASMLLSLTGENAEVLIWDGLTVHGLNTNLMKTFQVLQDETYAYIDNNVISYVHSIFVKKAR
jgi:hypothetical protein